MLIDAIDIRPKAIYYLFNIKIVHWVQTKHNKKRKNAKKNPIKTHKDT